MLLIPGQHFKEQILKPLQKKVIYMIDSSFVLNNFHTTQGYS